MNLIPRIRTGEDLSVDKLNAVIDKLNSIEISKRELEKLKTEIRSDLEKNNALLESIKSSQSSVQQIAQSDSMETLIQLINMIVAKQAPSSRSSQQYFKMEGEDNHVTIYLMEKGQEDSEDTVVATFTLTQGKDGDIGPQGPEGQPGPEGKRGPIGPRGFRGITGEKGEGVEISAQYTIAAEPDKVPTGFTNFLRLDIKQLNSDGSEKSSETKYIPTHGYLYVPKVELREENGELRSYLVFNKLMGDGTNDPEYIDRNYDITGAQGPEGPQGAQGLPGTGLTCSNLLRISDDDILERTLLSEEVDCTLDSLLLQTPTAAGQDELIARTLSGKYTDKVFGVLPLDSTVAVNTDGALAHKFTFVVQVSGAWKLCRGTSIPQNGGLSNIELHSNDLENPITQILNDRYKLIIGTCFLHIPENDSAFNTILYTLYDRPHLNTSIGAIDNSYYLFNKNHLNAGVAIRDDIKEDIYAHNILLPTEDITNGNITARAITSKKLSLLDTNAADCYRSFTLTSSSHYRGGIYIKDGVYGVVAKLYNETSSFRIPQQTYIVFLRKNADNDGGLAWSDFTEELISNLELRIRGTADCFDIEIVGTKWDSNPNLEVSIELYPIILLEDN